MLVAETVSEQIARSVTALVEADPVGACAVSFPLFCMRYLGPHFDTGFSEFQYPIAATLQDLLPGQNAQFLVPREHGKSTLMTMGYVVWLTCYRKKRYMMIGSAVQESSEEFLANVRRELQGNEAIVADFGHLAGKPTRERRAWRVDRIHTANEVVIRATSTGRTIRGALENLPADLHTDFLGYDDRGVPIYRRKNTRPDLLLLDDMIDDKRILSRRVRDRTESWFWRNAFAALSSEAGNCVIAGTTLHEDDLNCRIYNDRERTAHWIKVRLSAADPDRPFEEDGTPRNCLFPEKWAVVDKNLPIKVQDSRTGEERIEYRSRLWWKWRQLGPAFGPEFLMRPLDDATRYFRREDMTWYVVRSPHVTGDVHRVALEQLGKPLEYLPSDLICVTALDPAGTEIRRVEDGGQDPDYTAVVTAGYSPSVRKFYMVAVNRMRCTAGDMLQQLLIHLQMFDRRYGARYVPDRKRPSEFFQGLPFEHLGAVIETVAFQKVLAPMLEEIAPHLGMHPLVIEADRGGGRGKLMRPMLPSALCQSGLLCFPYVAPGWVGGSDVQAGIEELCAFPQGAHDDVVDAFTDALTVLHAFSIELGRGLHGPEALRSMLAGSYGMRAASPAAVEAFLATGLGGLAPEPVAPAYFERADRLPAQNAPGQWLDL